MPTSILIHVLTIVCIYGIMALGMNLVVGCTALTSIAQAALMGVGAYTSALLALAGLPWWFDVLAAICVVGFVSFLIGLLTLKLEASYLALATLGLGEAVTAVFKNWESVTRGVDGLPGIPYASLFGFTFDSPIRCLGLGAACLLIAYLALERVVWSPFGRVLKGIRDDETAVQALGKNTFWFKVGSFVLGGAFAGLAGSLDAHYVTFIDPFCFTFSVTLFLMLVIVLGGLGNSLGSVVATFILVGLREGLRFVVPLPGGITALAQDVVFGTLLIVMLIYRPKGFIPERKYRARYKPDAES